MPQPTKTRYGGRFRFDLPIDLKPSGEGAFVKGVEIRGVDLPPAPTLEAARSAFWKQRLVEVRDLVRTDDSPPMIDERELQPGVSRLMYRGYSKDDLVLETLLDDHHQRAVLIVAEWRQSYEPEDRPAQNAERERAFNEVVNAFSFLPPNYVATDLNAFYVKQGAIRLPYTASNVEHVEHFGLDLEYPTHSVRFDFDYDYVKLQGDDQPRGLLARLANAAAQSAVVGRPIRSGRMVVGGFPGEEVLLHSGRTTRFPIYGCMRPRTNPLALCPASRSPRSPTMAISRSRPGCGSRRWRVFTGSCRSHG